MKNKSNGFTLIEIMVSVVIFSIIATISYRVITSLVKTKEIVDETQQKWGDISLMNSNLEMSIHRLIPLTVRDNNGGILPALYGKERLSGVYDAQLEMTLSGYIGDNVLGVKPPKRVGYRFYKDTIYLVTWPVLNRALNSVPEIDVLVGNVENFEVLYLYDNGQWNKQWPPEGGNLDELPVALQIRLGLKSGESEVRTWSLQK